MSDATEGSPDNVTADPQQEFMRRAISMFGGEALAAAAMQHERDMGRLDYPLAYVPPPADNVEGQ